MRFIHKAAGDDALILRGRPICRGRGTGELVLLQRPFSFLGGVDPLTGILSSTSGAEGRSIVGKVFAFPNGRGSTVGSYTLLQLRKAGRLPAAIINQKAETIVATGAVMAGVPMVDSLDIGLLRDGDRLSVDGESGEVEVQGVQESRVVTCVIMHGGKLLALKRSQKVSTNRGLWAGVSGYIEDGEEPLDTALKEMREETAITEARLVKTAPVYSVRADDRVWRIHPFLFDSSAPDVTIDWEHTEYRWIDPGEVERMAMVPGFVQVLRSLLA